MSKWKRKWVLNANPRDTADAGEQALISTDDGVIERATATAENVAAALARLVETLENKGLLTSDEVQRVLNLYGYDKVEG
jgi:hypothetical protein